jgi:hypothetical protein
VHGAVRWGPVPQLGLRLQDLDGSLAALQIGTGWCTHGMCLNKWCWLLCRGGIRAALRRGCGVQYSNMVRYWHIMVAVFNGGTKRC